MLCWRKLDVVQIAASHSIHYPFNRFLALPSTQSGWGKGVRFHLMPIPFNEDDDDGVGNPKCMGSFAVTGLAGKKTKDGAGSQHK